MAGGEDDSVSQPAVGDCHGVGERAGHAEVVGLGAGWDESGAPLVGDGVDELGRTPAVEHAVTSATTPMHRLRRREGFSTPHMLARRSPTTAGATPAKVDIPIRPYAYPGFQHDTRCSVGSWARRSRVTTQDAHELLPPAVAGSAGWWEGPQECLPPVAGSHLSPSRRIGRRRTTPTCRRSPQHADDRGPGRSRPPGRQ